MAGRGLEKERVPVSRCGASELLRYPGNTANFQNAKGMRQVIVQSGNNLHVFELDSYARTLADDGALNSGVMSFQGAKNLLFMANGRRMMKWNRLPVPEVGHR